MLMTAYFTFSQYMKNNLYCNRLALSRTQSALDRLLLFFFSVIKVIYIIEKIISHCGICLKSDLCYSLKSLFILIIIDSYKTCWNPRTKCNWFGKTKRNVITFTLLQVAINGSFNMYH